MSQLLSPHIRKHLPALDSVRGVAILGVFCFHLVAASWGDGAEHLPWAGYLPNLHKVPSHLLWFYPCTFGWLGVSLFFVLSGFVIHYSTITAGKSFSVSSFYSRRFWRIYPPYLLALVVFYVMQVYLLPGSRQPFGIPNRASFVVHAVLLQDFSSQSFFLVNPSFWSIATEVQFYLVYPLLLLLRSRIGMTRVLLGVMGFSLAMRILICIAKRHSAEAFDQTHLMLWASPMITIFDWTLGAFLADRFAHGKRVFPKSAGILLATGLLFVLSTVIRPMSIFSFQLGSLFCAVWIERVIWSERPLSIVEKPLIYLGICSYSFYLFHQPLLVLMVRQFRVATNAGPAVAALSCGPVIFLILLVLSLAIYHAIERPSMELGRKLSRNRRGPDFKSFDPQHAPERSIASEPVDQSRLAQAVFTGKEGA